MKPELIQTPVGDWQLIHPECVDKYSNEYWEAIEMMDYNPHKAEKKLKQIIKKCKNGYIDAILHLGFLYNDIGRCIEGNALIYKAHLLALEAMPEEFDQNKHEIIWGLLGNRPFLRTFHGVGLELMKDKDYQTAVKKFNFVLDVNPNDNQGLRYLLLECLFHLKEPKNILALFEKYPDECSIDFLYGEVLVNFQLQNIEKAIECFNYAYKEFPFGGKEIIKKQHPKPKNEILYGDGIAVGSKYEAYDFWQRNKQFWIETDGVISFIKDNLIKSKRKNK